MKDIKITIEDADQKAFITLKEVGEDEENLTLNVKATFEPPIDKTKDEQPNVVGLTFNILRKLRE